MKMTQVYLDQKVSEEELDVLIPSYPGSPRSISFCPGYPLHTISAEGPFDIDVAVEFLQVENEFLIAAEIGNDKLIEIFLRKGIDIQQRDHLGRNALHLAVCSESLRATQLLLDAGVAPNVKDNLGLTPLSLCLMRRPSIAIANLLFAHGAKINPRTDPTDTGLFIQFAMMCLPTEEEEAILKLLIEKGALINDPSAPGGRQAIHFASMSNNTRLIKLLVELGADLSLKNHRNETAKEQAATFKCIEAYNLLDELELASKTQQSIGSSSVL